MENFAKDRPARIEFYWPAPGLNDESQRRPLALLTRILEDRLRVKIREEKGAAYAPQSGVMYNEAFDDFVFLGCRLEIPVARVGKTLDEVLSEVRTPGATSIRSGFRPACSTVSVVSTPKMIGTPVESVALIRPEAAWPAT